MDPSGPVAGPSRPRRVPNPAMELSERALAAQRKTASSSGPSRSATPPHSIHASQLTVRGPQRRSEADEYSRGPTQPARRALFDPSRAVPPPRVESPLPIDPPFRATPPPPVRATPPPPARQPGSPSRHREREASDSSGRRRAESPIPARGPKPPRKLFDPTVHDPHQFSRPPPTPGPSSPIASSRPSEPALAVRRAQLPRTAEEEADRERERRRRKEGSERGSGSSGRKKEDSGGKSKGARSLGSRSSEGSESFKDRERGKGKGSVVSDTGVKAILKDIHDRIKAIELDLTEMHRKMAADPEAGIAVLLEPVRGQPKVLGPEEDAALWLDLIGKHKQYVHELTELIARLADLHHDFLTRIFDPLVPPSLHQLTVRYNIPSRLWQNGFHLLLERLRHSWMTGHPTALDLLTDFVYDGYKFYTDLLEDVALGGFRTAWIEALGDLARYRMAIARQLALSSASASGGKGKGKSREGPAGAGGESSPVQDGASIGAEVAERWDVEDTDTWRQTASDWYSMGITEKPGEGRLHHHLALLARDMPDGEGRALHHFTRSLVVTHEFPTARESILGFFDLAAQRRMERMKSGEKDSPMELFIRLHGMLFTRIELDRFDETLNLLLSRLEEGEEGVGQVEWMMMASVGIAGMMQYGQSDGVLRKGLAQESAERRKNQASPGDDEPDAEVEEEGAKGPEGEENGVRVSDPDTWPLPLTCAFRLAFAILGHTLRHPTIAQGVHNILKPYLATFLTFLATLARQPATAAIIIPWIPWSDLTSFVDSTLPPLEIKAETKLITGQPVPEDWLLRGAEWVGRRVYERGFWKVKPSSGRGSGGMTQPTQRSGERFGSEMDVLLAHFEEGADVSQGVVDAPEGMEEVDGPVEVGKRRWKRVGWAVGVLSRFVPGLEVIDGMRVVVGEPLKSMVEDLERKRAEEERQKGQSGQRRNGWQEEETEEEWEVGDNNDPELAVLRDRFKHPQSLISTPLTNSTSKSRSTKNHRSPSLRVVQGYTTLIFDTNVLLSSLALIARLIESGRWTIVIPLPVLTELDGLAREPPPLGIEAVKAISYLEANVRVRSMVLRIQTTKGSYLSDLRLRTEAADAVDAAKDRKTMDDKILDVARWQLDHFVDRSLMLGGAGLGGAGKEASKAVLITFDRNLRLRARAAGVDAVDEREMADILGK